MVDDKKTVSNESTEESSLFDLSDEASMEEYSQLIDDEIILGKIEVAEERLNAFHARFGDKPEYLLLLAHLQKARGDMSGAYHLLKKLFYEYPSFMRERRDYEAFRSEIIGTRLEKAKAQWNRVLLVTSKNLDQDGDDSPSDKVGPQLKEKISAEIEKVISIYEEILQLEPFEISAIKGLIHCYSELGKADLMIAFQENLKEALNSWSTLSEKRVQSLVVEGKKYLFEQKYDEAIKIINLGLEESPLNNGLLLFKAEVLKNLERFKDAIACIDAVIKDSPHHAEALRLKKKILMERLEFDLNKGQEILLEAEEKIPGSNAQIMRAKDALEHFLAALTFDPSNLRSLVGLYRGHILSNNPVKAQKTAERIKEIDPNYPLKAIPSAPTGHPEEPEEQCFVATRLFGQRSYEVAILRKFRDERMKPFLLGRLFVRLYKRVGFPLSRISLQNPLLSLFRGILRLWVKLLTLMNKDE